MPVIGKVPYGVFRHSVTDGVGLIICNTYYTLIVIFVISDLTSQKNQMQIVLIFIARQHTDARHLYSNYSVCPSVCLSVHPSVRNVPVSDENG